MVSINGTALKAVQSFLRAIVFLCAVVVLAIYAYFLWKLAHHDIAIQTWVRAVEGLAGSAALYGLVGVSLLWCLAGHTVASAIALFLDICFVGCFIYIAAANRAGASSCNGDKIKTPFGTAAAATRTVTNSKGKLVDDIPSFRTSCKLETACLAVSAIAAVFLIMAFFVEILLAKHHRKEKKFGPGPNNNYTSGSGKRRLGLFGFKRKGAAAHAVDPNVLPVHAEPGQVRESYNTETTATDKVEGRQYGNLEPVRYDLPQQLNQAHAKY